MSALLGLVGGVLWMVAAYFTYTAFGIETAVPVAEPIGPFPAVANLQAMHFQTANLIIAAGAAICGTLFLLGAVITAEKDKTPPSGE